MNEYVIVKIGNSQELVHKGDEVIVHKLAGEPKTKVSFDEVLLKQTKDEVLVGTPIVAGVKVEAEIVEHTKGEKVRKETYKAKARQRRHVGHRQELTKIKITKI